MTLHTLLDDEQKAFEKRFPLREIEGRINEDTWFGNPPTPKEIKDFLALHDQKIITAVIGGIEKKMDEWMAVTDVDNPLSVKDIKDELLSDPQQALKNLSANHPQL